jgi:hypothetical protein
LKPRDVLHGYGDDDDVSGASGLLYCNPCGTGLLGQRGKRCRPARVRDKYVMAERSKTACQGTADLACADDSDFHVSSL